MLATFVKTRYDARGLSSYEQACLRQAAVSRVISGEKIHHVTEDYGLGDKTLYKWLKTYRLHGPKVLTHHAKQGRKRQVSPESLSTMLSWLTEEVGTYWTRQSLLAKASAELAIGCSASTLARLLKISGLVIPEFSNCYQAFIVGRWCRLDSKGLQNLVRRKQATRCSLVSASLSVEETGFLWSGWVLFTSKGEMAFYPKTSLEGLLNELGHLHDDRYQEAKVILVQNFCDSASRLNEMLAELHSITLVQSV